MTPDAIIELHQRRVLEYGFAGPRLCKPRHAVEIVGIVLQSRAQWALLPAERIAAEFFDLKSGLAGESSTRPTWERCSGFFPTGKNSNAA